MNSESLLNEIREANLSYLLLAQRMIREDRAQALFRLGISEQVKGKTIEIQGKELVGTALARGDADIGMQQVSELKVTPGVD